MSQLEDLQREEIAMLRERIRQLEMLLQPEGVVVPPEWQLSPTEAMIYRFLLTREMASKRQIMDVIYLGRPGDAPNVKIVDVYICKLRKKLKGRGVEIVTHWGAGYGIAERTRHLPRRAA